MDRVVGLDSPGTPGWTLNETTDLLLKKEFDACRATRRDLAIRSAKSIAQRLEGYWLSLRLSKLDVPAAALEGRLMAITESLTASSSKLLF